MPDGYALSDARFVQEKAIGSAANAEALTILVCPAGKICTILSAGYSPSVTETQVVYFEIYSKAAYDYPITMPVSISLGNLVPRLPCLTEGMEIKIFPGEALLVIRGGHTAGSTMSAYVRWIETDLPFYKYTEPLKPVVDRTTKHGSAFRGAGSGSGGSTGGGIIGGGHPTGGGGGGALPV
jgi:uncharacterized membrane protein YgcG